MKTFLLKAKHFFKRNIYPITVGLCTVLVLGIVAISAYTSIKNSNESIFTDNPAGNEQTDNVNDGSDETTSTEGILFDLPFENATISKKYAEKELLYDATTKYWCTHQALDFACNDGQMSKAVYDGKIIKVESSMMNGTVVYLEVADNLVVTYKGLDSNVLVKEGDEVKKGQDIGKITGFLAEKADGVHLHLELTKDDKLIDPTEYFSFNK